jgi:general secretion pathway protein A
MFNGYWGLRHSPFEFAADAGSFYPSRTHDEALARMAFLAEQRRRVGALKGPAGIGKSYVLGMFARQMQRRGARLASLSLSGIPASEIAWELADRLGVAGDEAQQGPRLWRRLREHFQENTAQGVQSLVLIDDADGGEAGCGTTLERLAQLDAARRSDFTLIVAVETRAGALGDWLSEAADLWIPLEPLDLEETAGYVAHRWKQAGGQESPFDEAALGRLHELCGGIPRRLNQLCDLALVAAMGEGEHVIGRERVESVREQLCMRKLPVGAEASLSEAAVSLVS